MWLTWGMFIGRACYPIAPVTSKRSKCLFRTGYQFVMVTLLNPTQNKMLISYLLFVIDCTCISSEHEQHNNGVVFELILSADSAFGKPYENQFIFGWFFSDRISNVHIIVKFLSCLCS